MSVLTFKSDEFKTFPPVLKDYASYLAAVKVTARKQYVNICLIYAPSSVL